MKLTDSQLIVLSAASSNADLSVLPLPTKMKGVAGDKIVKSLLARKLIAEQPLEAGSDLLVHRMDKRGRRLGLVVTAAGLQELGAEPERDATGPDLPASSDAAAAIASATTPADEGAGGAGATGAAERTRQLAPPRGKRAPKAQATARNTDAAMPRADSKLAKLIALLRRRDGATVDQIAKALDWQRHTVRGAIAGALKKKRGLAVTSTKDAGGMRTYRIVD